MKKTLIALILILFAFTSYGQKITNLTKASSADSTSLIMVRQGNNGNLLKKISKGDFLKNVEDYISDIGSTNAGTIIPLQSDTVPLIAFGIGSGATADTACFNNSRLAGAFFNEGSDTLHITQLMGILKEGTGTETISVQISWHATFLSGSATNLNSSALAITSITTGTSDTSFANSAIPPNVWVWCILSGASKDNKPTYLGVTLSGYKQNRNY